MKMQYLFHGFVTGMTMLFSLSHVLAQPGNLCGATQNPLTGNYEIPMDGYTYNFTDAALSPSQVFIGFPTCVSQPTRFYVSNDVHQVAGVFESIVNNALPTIGIASYAINTGSGSTFGIGAEVASSGVYATAITARAITSGSTYCIGLDISAANGASQSFGVNSDILVSSSPFNYGYQTEIENGTNVNAISYGVHSTIFNQASTNYAGYFLCQGSATNYAIYASSTPSSGNNPPTGPNYAGYFNGDVLRTGTDNFTSDLNLKKEIQAIQNGIATVSQLNPVTFEFKQEEYPSIGLSGGTNYGFIAQEVEKILPDLVREEHHPAQYDKEGNLVHEALKFKSMNYQGIIPVLTKAIQEQNELINDLNSRLSQLENCLSRILPSLCQINHGEIRENSIDKQQFLENIMNVELSGQETIILNQNIPNPFAESTMITYNIPENVKSAQLHFYDALGKLIKTVDLTSRGSGYIHVFGADLATGAYTYALVADGQIVSTRKMVKE